MILKTEGDSIDTHEASSRHPQVDNMTTTKTMVQKLLTCLTGAAVAMGAGSPSPDAWPRLERSCAMMSSLIAVVEKMISREQCRSPSSQKMQK